MQQRSQKNGKGEREGTHRRPPRFPEPLHELVFLFDRLKVDREHRYALAVIEALELLLGHGKRRERLALKPP